MANTVPDGIWYPDEDTTIVKLDQMFATQASSIANGIGKRLKHQEIAVGAKLSCSSNAITIGYIAGGTNPQTVIPYTNRGATNADFVQGLANTGGIVTIATAGMYIVSANIGVRGPTTNTNGMKIALMKNAVITGMNEVSLSSTAYVAVSVVSVLNCVPGDTISARVGITGTPTGQTYPNDTSATHMSVAMVQALPL